MQSSPWLAGEEEPRLAGRIPVTVVAGGEGEPARKDQGARAGLAGGDVKVGVDRRGWNDDDPRWHPWSSTMATVFWCGGSLAAVQRLGRSSRGARRFN
jgi:hypothetical protein